MNYIRDKLKAEFINGQTKYDWMFLVFGLLLQVVAILYGYKTGEPSNTLSIIAALAGVISVVLCAQGKISFYLFGYIQLFAYVFGAALPNHLWGEVVENGFYLITMIYGTFVWFKNYKLNVEDNGYRVQAKKLKGVGWIITLGALIIGVTALTIILAKTNDPLPFLDAISTIPAFIAQILMCLGYREQWLHWLIIDVASIVMFIILGNWVMVAQFVFWTINCIYGWYKWSKNFKVA